MSIVRNYKNGILVREAHYSNGLLHNINGPALTLFYSNGIIREKKYMREGVVFRYRYEGPAICTYDRSGELIMKVYMEGDKTYYVKPPFDLYDS